MLTVEITEDSSVVELHGDSAGLLAVAGVLTELATRQTPDHANLLSDEWGGNLPTSQAENERPGAPPLLPGYLER